MNKLNVDYEESYLKLKEDYPAFNINNKKIDCFPGLNNEKKLSVIVPIHNNGRYLKFKCFNSLKKLSCFEDLEIIFIDDGSSDNETLRIINDILNSQKDIVYKRFERGSGSASRPRNKGVEYATTDYITFLDPDNEAIDDGFSKLLEEVTEDVSLDMVVGNIVREDNLKRNEINYYKKVFKIQQSEIITETRDVLISTNLTVQSIQALVVKKEIIENNYLKMVEGAAGQDTLFFQELLLKCDKVKVINQMIHSYYAYVEGSITNTVTHRFFEKFYQVEKERIKFLEKENLIDVYMTRKFNFYIKNWYLKKLSQVASDDEKRRSLDYVKKILELYKNYERYFDVFDL